MILRSLLFVPGNNEKLIRKAALSQADALILDLEDSVVKSAKQEAREVIKSIISEEISDKHHVFVRTNDLHSGEIEADFEQLSLKEITGFIVPKSYTKEDIITYEKILEKHEKLNGFKKNRFKLIPLIETASAVLHTEEICRSSERIIAAAFGSEDFCADIKGIHDEEHKSLHTPRALIAMAARTTGVIPIDTLHVRVHDLEDLKKNLQLARNLGFEGSLLLHPKEIRYAHRFYSPTSAEVEYAKKVIDLSRQAEKEKIRVAIIDGVFIGPPMLRQAKLILQRHEAIRKWEDGRK